MRWGVVGVLFGQGCVGQTGEAEPIPIDCPDVVRTEVADDDDSLGFTAQDVIDALPRPTAVAWEWALAAPLRQERHSLRWSDLQLSGPVRTADYTAEGFGCSRRGEIHLVVPVQMRIDLGSGQAVGVGVHDVQASGPQPDQIHSVGGAGPELTVSGGIGSVVQEWEDASDVGLGSVHLRYGGFSSASLWVLDASGESSSLWMGELEFDPSR
ncbi:MAG: hypothetical protein KTR31_20070 [Myxococcales bacterium]|nr:hypothetical protein [Myxococcales bacterium]